LTTHGQLPSRLKVRIERRIESGVLGVEPRSRTLVTLGHGVTAGGIRFGVADMVRLVTLGDVSESGTATPIAREDIAGPQ
jgi:hypothetical protein